MDMKQTPVLLGLAETNDCWNKNGKVCEKVWNVQLSLSAKLVIVSKTTVFI